MTFAHFETYSEAKAHRARMGGWLAIPNEGGFYWFDLSHTPTRVMLHPILHGMHVRLY